VKTVTVLDYWIMIIVVTGSSLITFFFNKPSCIGFLFTCLGLIRICKNLCSRAVQGSSHEMFQSHYLRFGIPLT
jgi:hypothetical protein